MIPTRNHLAHPASALAVTGHREAGATASLGLRPE